MYFGSQEQVCSSSFFPYLPSKSLKALGYYFGYKLRHFSFLFRHRTLHMIHTHTIVLKLTIFLPMDNWTNMVEKYKKQMYLVDLKKMCHFKLVQCCDDDIQYYSN